MPRSRNTDPAEYLRCSEELRHKYDHTHGPADELHDPVDVIAKHVPHPNDPAAELHRSKSEQDSYCRLLRNVTDYLRVPRILKR